MCGLRLMHTISYILGGGLGWTAAVHRDGKARTALRHWPIAQHYLFRWLHVMVSVRRVEVVITRGEDKRLKHAVRSTP